MVRFLSLGGAAVTLLCCLALWGDSGTFSPLGQTPTSLDNCWQDLASEDAAKAYRATWLLAQQPTEAVKLLRQHMKPAPGPDVDQMRSWVADLDSDKYAVRAKAAKELEMLGELAEQELRKVLAGNPPLETRQRVQMLVDKLQGTVNSPEKLRQVRAVEVLELVGTAEAKAVLEHLAKGFGSDRLTQEAQGSVKRLKERVAVAAPLMAPKQEGDEALPFGARVRLGTTLFRQPAVFTIATRINAAAFSSDSDLLAAISQNERAVYLWKARTGKLRRKLNYNASALAMSPKGSLLAIGTRQLKGDEPAGMVIWDWCDEKELARLPLPSGISFFDQIRFTPDGTRLLAKGRDNILRAWDTSSFKETTVWKAVALNKAPIAINENQLDCFSQDGHRALVGTLRVGGAFIVDLGKGDRVALQSKEASQGQSAFSWDGKYLARGSSIGLRLFDTASGKLKLTQAANAASTDTPAFTPDGKQIAASEYRRGISVWDVETGKFLRSLPASQNFSVAAISPDSHWLAGIANESIRIWNLDTGQAIDDGDGHVQTIRTIAVSPRLDVIATGGNDGSLRLWDAVTGKQTQVLMTMDRPTFVAGVAFSPDGKWLASSDLEHAVRVWDADNGKLVYKFLGHGQTGGTRVVRFSPDNRYLLSWGDDFYLRKWDMTTGKAVLEQRTRGTGFELPADDDDNARPVPPAAAFQMGVSDGRFTPDTAQFLLVPGRGAVHCFDTNTGKETRVLKSTGGSTSSLAISPAGRHLALLDYERPLGFSMSVLELNSGKVVFKTELAESAGSVVFSADGRLVAAVSGTKMVIVEVASGKTRVTVENLPSVSSHLTFAADGRTLVTTMGDTTALVWDLAILAGRK